MSETDLTKCDKCEAARIAYSEAAQMLRACDTLAYNLLQFFFATFAGMVALQYTNLFHPLAAGATIIVVSVVFALVMLRLRRNHDYFISACKSLEAGFGLAGARAPFDFVDTSLKGEDKNYRLSGIGTKKLYLGLYLGGLLGGLGIVLNDCYGTLDAGSLIMLVVTAVIGVMLIGFCFKS